MFLVIAIVSAIRAIIEQFSVPHPNISIIIRSWVQVGLIIMVITINTYIGILGEQEGYTEKRVARAAAEALENARNHPARVIRDAREVRIPTSNIVPGDVIILDHGDVCPADMRIIKSSKLACNESSLSNNTLPVEKTIEAIDVPPGLQPEQIALGDRRNVS